MRRVNEPLVLLGTVGAVVVAVFLIVSREATLTLPGTERSIRSSSLRVGTHATARRWSDAPYYFQRDCFQRRVRARRCVRVACDKHHAARRRLTVLATYPICWDSSFLSRGARHLG